MELPVIKEARRFDEDAPKVFLWERKGEPDTGIYRPRLCFTLPRKDEGAVALLFEEAEFGSRRRFTFLSSRNSATPANCWTVYASCGRHGKSKTSTHG